MSGRAKTCWGSLLLTLAMAVAVASACGADDEIPEGHIPCGLLGGSCEAGTQICVVVDDCSTCIDVPTGCEAGSSCECIAASDDADDTLSSCNQNGTCEQDGDGLRVTCDVAEPMLGCG